MIQIKRSLPGNHMTTQTPMDTTDLRRALGRFGTGVTIVSTLDAQGVPTGVTANSFSSVSLDPPIVLWSLRRASPSLAAFDATGRFVINVLALEQVELSRRFASPVADKFAGVGHTRGLGGLPVVEGCAAVFECRTEQRLEVGDHVLFLGLVEAYGHQVGPTLLYCQGQYAQGVNLETPPPPTPTATRTAPCATAPS
jgi:flavin reductase (DIM6/NTAB) family NADH-FMN oxidoreductase RutF